MFACLSALVVLPLGYFGMEYRVNGVDPISFLGLGMIAVAYMYIHVLHPALCTLTEAEYYTGVLYGAVDVLLLIVVWTHKDGRVVSACFGSSVGWHLLPPVVRVAVTSR